MVLNQGQKACFGWRSNKWVNDNQPRLAQEQNDNIFWERTYIYILKQIRRRIALYVLYIHTWNQAHVKAEPELHIKIRSTLLLKNPSVFFSECLSSKVPFYPNLLWFTHTPFKIIVFILIYGVILEPSFKILGLRFLDKFLNQSIGEIPLIHSFVLPKWFLGKHKIIWFSIIIKVTAKQKLHILGWNPTVWNWFF